MKPLPPKRRRAFCPATLQTIRLSIAAFDWNALWVKFLTLVLTYALMLQLVPRVAAAPVTKTESKRVATENVAQPPQSKLLTSGLEGLLSNVTLPLAVTVEPAVSNITDAVVSRQKPTLNSGRIEGALRLFSTESFSLSGNIQITSDLFLPGSPTIVVNDGSQYGGTVSDGGSETPNYTLTLNGGVNLPGVIHTRADAVQLPTDFPNSVPAASGTRTVSVTSQSAVAAIGTWQTVRDLNVTGSQIKIDVPPGNYGTFTVNGNSRLNFTAGTYNFSNSFNLDGSATIQTTGPVTINVGQNLTINSGAVALGSYTSPGDVRVRVLGSAVNIKGSSQVAGLLHAFNATATISGTAQVRGQVIANSVVLNNSGKVIGAVWPAQSGSCPTIFGPRRFDRTTGPPNQYVEQFSVPAGFTSPITLHIQNGEPDGTNRVSSATVKLNGVEIVSPNNLNQNVPGLDRSVTLSANNQLDVRVTSPPGSYLIINICGTVPVSDTTAPAITITSPSNQSTTTATQVNVAGAASDSGAVVTGVAHVYVNNAEAAYNSADGTWSIANVALALGSNQIVARAVDQAGNQATTTITVTRQAPTNHAPTANAGDDQTLTLPQTASLHGATADDGLPEGSTLTTTWIKVTGPGTVTFENANVLDTTASFSVAGTYVLRLTASDGALSTTDDVTITVEPQNQPPTVSAGPDQMIALPRSATLNGNVTDDSLPVGNALTTTWSQVSGPGSVTFEDATLTDTVASFSDAGTYVLRLTATDGELAAQSDVTITVHPENHAPVVSAGQDQIISLPSAAQLNGSASDDGWPYGSSLTTSWSMVSGPGSVVFDNPNSPATSAHFSSAGPYLLRLTATDSELTSTADVTITVTPPNQAPTVDAGPDQSITLPNVANLNGTVGDDGLPLGSSVSTIWTQFSGPGTVTFAHPNVTITTASFSVAGTYVLRLSATDSQLSSSADITITVIPENHAPTVNAGADQTITLPNTARLNGSVSDDGLPQGSSVSTTWSLVSGPGTVTFANSTVTVTTAAFSVDGTYVLRLAASDSDLAATDDITITVIPENHAPTVNAGADQTITLPNQASLSGSVTDDGLPAGSSLSTTWSQVSGPGTVSFANPAATATTATFSLAGTYVLRLAATDSDLSANDDLTVTVDPENQPPTVNAGADQAITLPATASLNGAVTDDGWPRGSSVSTSWSQVSGPGTATFNAAASAATIVSFSQAGTYVLRLTATDSQLTSSDDIQITVIPENHAPTANSGSDQIITLPAQANLNGSVSDDGLPAGSTLTTVWSKVSGPGTVTFANANVTVTSAAFSEAGTYVLRLTTSDSELSASDEVQITVIAENHAPTANAGTDQQVTLPNTAALNGSVNDDGLPAGSTLTSTWSIVTGPGTVAFGNPGSAITTAAFSVAGTYVLKLTVSDSELSASDEVQITVIPENHAPTANAGADQTITLPAQASLNGTVSDDGYPTGSTLTSIWSKVSGPGTVTFANPNVTVTTAAFSVAGTYVLRLTASDSELSASDDVQVTVIAQNLAPTVNAGADQAITYPAVANLNGSVSDDGLPAGSTLTTTWSKVSGPGAVTFGNPSVTVTTAAFSEPGNYVLRLTASDSELTASDDLTITVSDPRVPPVANFTVPESTGTAGLIVTSSSAIGGGSVANLLDDNANTFWQTIGITNQFATFQFLDQQQIFIDRVRLQSNTQSNCLKDFEVRVSSTDANDGSFATVLTATLLNNGQLQEFVFPGGPARARYIKLLMKTNYGASNIVLGTFNPVAVGSADRLLSLPGQANVARSQSPVMIFNGGAIHSASYGSGFNNADGLLGFGRGGFVTTSLSDQFAIIQLGGGQAHNIKGVRLAAWYDSGFGSATAVKDFEVWVSATTPDPSSFTKVLAATTVFIGNVQTFMFPGGPVPARYVKYVPLNTHGTGTTINTVAFDVLSDSGARVIAVSSVNQNSPLPPEAAFDGDTNSNTSQWFSQQGQAINQWVKTSLADDQIQKVFGFRIYPSVSQGPKDIEIRVSTTTTDDSAFTTVYTGTLPQVFSINPQDIILPNLIDAKYVQFFWKNAHSTSSVGVRELEVLAAPKRGSAVIGYSQTGFFQGAGTPEVALDLDPTGNPWTTPVNQNTSVSFKLVLERAELQAISHIALRPAIASNGVYSAPKDFQLQVSTTDFAEASFTTVFSGTLVSSTQLQDFYFAPVQAKYVRLTLIKGPNDFSSFALHNFLIYTSNAIGTTTRFIDRSSDSDGQVVSWAWNFGDGATSTEKNPTHTFAQPGDYTVSLAVTDNSGLTNNYSALYRVVDSLTTDFAISPMIAHEAGESVRFTDLQELFLHPTALRTYDWGDGSALYTQYARNIVHTYNDSGIFQVTLRVGDALGVRHTVTKTITVLNVPPTVDIPAGKTVVWGENWTSVPTINDQSPVDKLSLTGEWLFGDGQTSQCVNCTNANATVTHAYSLPGTYTTTLTIRDKDGGVTSDSAVYNVTKRPTAVTFLTTQPQGNGETYLVRAKLMDTYANVPLGNKTLHFVLNGVTASAVTDATGVAEVNFNFASGAVVGHGAATFVEDSMYFGSSGAFGDPLPPTTPPPGLSNKGKDFWVVTTQNVVTPFGRVNVLFYITSEVATTGTITQQILAPINFSVPANGVTSVPPGLTNHLFTSDAIENKGIRVTSQQPITLMELNDYHASTDAYLALPTEALGTEYIVLGYANGSNLQGTHFGIVAPFNDTVVTITPTITTGPRLAGVPFTITLNQGQTYYLRNDQPGKQFDFTGTLISSTKPIAVFGGHKAGSVPDGAVFADHLEEQLPPTNTWGKHFVTMPYKIRNNGDTFRFLAAEDNTSVYINGHRVTHLNRAQFHERIVNGPAYIISDKPILVAQYSNGSSFDGAALGDPSMALIPPYEQYLDHYVVASPDFGDVQFINVVAPASAVGSVILDGAAIPSSSFVPIANSGFSGAQISVARGVHKLSGPSAFGVSLYGFGPFNAYSFPGGMNLRPTAPTGGLTLTPNIASATIGTQQCVNASLKDQFGVPLGSQSINFSVTGANPSSSSATTNAGGQANLCYVGTSTGTDSITATSGNTQATATIIWSPPNQAPVVNAGVDQVITLPVSATLSGSATDDGLPVNTLVYSWSKFSGPGNVTFANASAASTVASFDTAGTYVLRLSASDTALSGSDDVQITVNPAPPNGPPTANAGPDQSATINGNLIINGGNDLPLVDGEIPGWTEAQGTTWTQGSPSNGTGFPEAERGGAYFYSGNSPLAELRQDIDVTAFAGNIAAGTQQFEFEASLRALAEASLDSARVYVEYRDATNTNVIAALDSGEINTSSGWHLTEDVRNAPVGTGWIRVRLIATRNVNAAGDASNDAYFDSISLRPVGAAAVKLNGVVNDDGLPFGSTLTSTWSFVSGPGTVIFGSPNAAVTGASFTTAGTYVLRLTAGDGDASTSDEVSVVVNPANQPPSVNAGTNQTITLPASADLSGTVNDDGLPPGSNVSVEWTKVNGPGVVTFANANQTSTTASFSTAGTYVLRLTADDTEYRASSDVTITVNPAPVNQPPTISGGPDKTISLPTDTVTLSGSAADDGYPAGSSLSISWTTVSGPGSVTFGTPNAAVTTAQLSAIGTYVLRLTATDREYTVSDDVSVTLTAANQAPTVNAGADQTTILSAGAQLNGSVSDDGLPVGSNLTTNWSKVSGPGAVAFMNANVTVTGATFSATGTYVLRLTASDGELSASDDVTITVNDDVPAPTVEITAPADEASVTEPTAVTGSVSGGAWTLEYSLGSDDNPNNRVWTTIANGNGATSGTLGSLDPTMMLNGLFDIRLSATDQYGQISLTKVSVIVERNLKIGNFTLSFTDLSIPVAGVPMEVIRTYDSRDKRVGDFGFGWTMGLRNIRVEKAGVLGLKWYETVSQEVFPNYCIEPVGSHAVTVTFPGGKVFKFKPLVAPHCQRNAPITTGNISFEALPGTVGKLEVVGSSDVQIDGSVPGPVNLIGFGGGVDIFNSFVFKFTSQDGTAYIIDQRTGLQSLADTSGNTLTISPNGIVHSSGKSIVFHRDIAGRIERIDDPNGNSMFYEYDPNGDLISYTDNEGNLSTYTYDANHRLLTIKDPRGIQPMRNDYDPVDGRLISHTDAFGKHITYLHDIPNRTETIKDRLDHATVFEYDGRGNVLKKTDALNGVTEFTYDANDNVLTEKNALGKTTTYTYDENDNRTSVRDPLGNLTQFTYNALGKVLTVEDPLHRITRNTYDSAGRLRTTEDPLHNTTTHEYSVFDGQLISMTDALDHPTTYAYTSGHLTKQTDVLGNETTFTYDNNGNRKSQTVKRTNAQAQLETIITSFEYDKLNRLTKTTFADGSFTKVEYNSIGKQSATVDQLNDRTEFTYDDMGRLTKTTYADGKFEENTYDAEGRRLTNKDRAGHLTSYTYDALGRLTKTTFVDGTFTQTSYDAIGQVLTTTDARNNVTRYFYDDAGRQTKVRNALNQETLFTYDDNGNQRTMTDALNHTTTYDYDDNNRRTKTTYHDGTFDSVVYDKLGRTMSKTDQATKTTQFTYDELGRLTKVKDALNQETIYGYNQIGQQISQTDANLHTTRFEYDQLGRRVKRSLPAGQFETYSYDNVGNLQSKTDFNGRTTTFTYDSMRRLLSKTPDASFGQSAITFTYNSNGQRATMTDVSGTTVYGYDNRKRLNSKQTPFGTLSYTYNDAGSLLTTRSSNANGVSVDYTYDALNRLATVKDNNLTPLNGGVTNYTYDDVGNLQSYQYPNGVTTSYVYNSLNRLTTMTVGTQASSLASYSYTLGATGNRTAVTELSGRTVTYTYDDLYRLTSESITSDPHGINGSISYGYDPVGNRLNRTSTVAGVPSQTSTFDVNDRRTGDNYDNNGNTTTASGNGYAYDFENHLTSLNNGAVTYVYDGDGNRVAKTIGGVTTNYLVDANNPTGYAQVVDELQGGVVKKGFNYGHDLISQRIVGGSLSFYQYDGHGSVRRLTDAAAIVTDAYDYDAFGNLIYRSGTTPNDYLYSGEQFDANLGSYYLRARYMNPSIGRFWTMDSLEGRNTDPRSLHKYLYVAANPANQVDPSGHVGTSVDLAVYANFNQQVNAMANLIAIAILQLIKKTLEDDSSLYVYRLGNPNSMRSVALRREQDWKSGLSFTTMRPEAKHLTYRVVNLFIGGFAVYPDGGRPFTNIIDGSGSDGAVAPPGHVSVFLPDRDRWDAWYNAEKDNTSQDPFVPNSPETSALYNLREIGPWP